MMMLYAKKILRKSLDSTIIWKTRSWNGHIYHTKKYISEISSVEDQFLSVKEEVTSSYYNNGRPPGGGGIRINLKKETGF